VADVLPEPIIAAPVSPGPWRDYWILADYRSGPPPVVAEASTLDGEMHLVARGAGLSITSEAVGTWYKRPGVTFVPHRRPGSRRQRGARRRSARPTAQPGAECDHKPRLPVKAIAAASERVLAAAVTAVLREGRQVPMGTIAAEAGVGVGTLEGLLPRRPRSLKERSLEAKPRSRSG
jgi:hypothetical protein